MKVEFNNNEIWAYVIMSDLSIQEMHGRVSKIGTFRPFYSKRVYKESEFFIFKEQAQLYRALLYKKRVKHTRMKAILGTCFDSSVLSLYLSAVIFGPETICSSKGETVIANAVMAITSIFLYINIKQLWKLR